MRTLQFKLKKTNRACLLFPWMAPCPRPWKDGYERVIVPFTQAELKNAKNGKRAHIQIVRRDSIELVSEPKLVLA